MALPPTAAAVLLLAAVVLVCTGVLILVLRPAVEALWRIRDEMNVLEATANAHREVVRQGLGQLNDSARHHTTTVRDTAQGAPEAVRAQRDQVSADFERLTRAVHEALSFTPDPDAGPYAAAGANEAMGHVRSTLRAAL